MILAGGLDQRRKHKCTDKIAEEHHGQDLNHAPCRKLAVQTAHDHQTVAGEQLAAHKYDHHKTHRENGAGHKTGQTHIADVVHGNGTGGSAAGDEHAGKDTQQNQTAQREGGLTLGGGNVGRDNLLRRQEGVKLVHGISPFQTKIKRAIQYMTELPRRSA